MENELREDLVMIFLGWFLSGMICIITLIVLYNNEWNFELTILVIVDFGLLFIFAVLITITTFLCRFKIVRK